MQNEKEFLGRKVFFLNPPMLFEDEVVEKLRVMEYEVYSVREYNKMRNFLTLNAGSIVFITPNDMLTPGGWKNFISVIEADNAVFGPVDVGVIMHKMAESATRSFITGLKLKGGVMQLEAGNDLLFQQIVKSLDALKAHGLRKNVRADCMNDKTAEVYSLKGTKMLRFKIIDISSAAIATKFPANFGNEIFENMLIPDARVNIGRAYVNASLIISAIKPVGDNLLVIFTYGASTSPDAMKKIRGYVGERLKLNMSNSVLSMPVDKTDYNKKEA